MDWKNAGEIMTSDSFVAFKKLFSSQNSEARLKIIVGIGVVAIALIFFSDHLTGTVKSSSAAADGRRSGYADTAEYADYNEYTRQLEQRLTELISSVDGAGQTKVMITLECGTEYVYASRQKTTSALSENTDAAGKSARDEKRTGEETLILVDGDGGEAPLILKEITPTVAGVVVVCSGADDINVRQRVTEIVTTALGTTSNRVCVTRMG